MSLLATIVDDLRAKARYCYGSDDARSFVKVILGDGSSAMIVYRLMQWSRRHRLAPLEMLFNKWNSIGCRCLIGRGAEFGPRLILLHAEGVVINGKVRGGSDVAIEHQVTLGADAKGGCPRLGDGVFLGAGAKVFGAISIGDGCRIGANAVVIRDVPPHSTAVGVPARVVRTRTPRPAEAPAGSYAAEAGR